MYEEYNQEKTQKFMEISI